MVKKSLLVLALAVVAAGGAFAQDDEKPKGFLSFGGGVLLVPSWSEMKPKGGGDASKTSGFGGGINLFLDAKYAELNLGLLFVNEKGDDADKGMDTTNLLIGLLLKYPFALNPKFALFPFAGIDYRIALGAKYEGEDWPDGIDMGEYFNALSVVFGVGVDYDITRALYIRGEIGFGITFNTKQQDDYKDYFDSIFNGKVPIKIAVGYRL
jgi:hypothetical protein